MKPGTKILGGAAALIASGVLALYTPELQQHLGRWEGESQNVVYPDTLAGGLPTVCKGITKWTSPDAVVVGDYWSPERCEEVERMVVERGQLQVADCIKVYVPQGVFDMISDHGHHFGVPTTCASRALGLMNAGNVRAGCNAFAHHADGRPAWSYTGGRFVQGLYNRAVDRRTKCLAALNAAERLPARTGAVSP